MAQSCTTNISPYVCILFGIYQIQPFDNIFSVLFLLSVHRQSHTIWYTNFLFLYLLLLAIKKYHTLPVLLIKIRLEDWSAYPCYPTNVAQKLVSDCSKICWEQVEYPFRHLLMLPNENAVRVLFLNKKTNNTKYHKCYFLILKLKISNQEV